MKEGIEMDRILELEYAIKEGPKEGIKEAFIHIITNYIKSCKEKPTAARLAAIFKVEQSLVESFLETCSYKQTFSTYNCSLNIANAFYNIILLVASQIKY